MAKKTIYSTMLFAIVGGALAEGAGKVIGEVLAEGAGKKKIVGPGDNQYMVLGGKAVIGAGLIYADKKKGAMSAIGAGMLGNAGGDLSHLLMPEGTNAPGDVGENLFFDPVSDDPLQLEGPEYDEMDIFGPADPNEIVAGPANPNEIVAAQNYQMDWSQLDED